MTRSIGQPVLYVEDEADDVLLVKLAFKRAAIPHPLRIAKDGREALDYLLGKSDFADREKHPLPAMVLLDVNLPHCSGLEVLQQVRGARHLQDLPVFMFSSSKHPTDVERARALGATDYLVKIGDVERLTKLLLQLTHRAIDHASAARS